MLCNLLIILTTHIEKKIRVTLLIGLFCVLYKAANGSADL